MRNYTVDYTRYTFKAEDDWGDYYDGEYREPWFDKEGYNRKSYLCTDGEWHSILEHRVKWIYFNGDIPEGMVIDHIIPIANGGTNKLSNLRLVTIKENCNNPFSKINYSIATKKLWENYEFRKKIEASFTEERRKSMSERMSGENSPFYGKHLSEETKRRISEAQLGEKNHMFGKHVSENVKKKMSLANKGKKRSEEIRKKLFEAQRHRRKKVYQYSLEGKLVKIWDSLSDVGRAGYNQSNIGMCCNNLRKKADGYRWSYGEI